MVFGATREIKSRQGGLPSRRPAVFTRA